MVCLKHLSLRGPTYINTLHKWSHSVNSCYQSALQGAVTSQLLPTLTNKKASKYVKVIYEDRGTFLSGGRVRQIGRLCVRERGKIQI